jgi:cytidylate kinase
MQFGQTVVTIGREYGSGGHEIGSQLAQLMGVPFYDREVLTRAARDSGICEDVLTEYDEKASSGYLFSLAAGISAAAEGTGLTMGMPLNHRVFLAQFEAISKIAAEGPGVIVGRCGDYVLRERSNVVNFFLYAPVEDRIQRIMKVEELPYDQAKDRVRRVDKQRQNYYNFFADGNWGHRGNYHLMVSTGGLTTQAVAEILLEFVKRFKA